MVNRKQFEEICNKYGLDSKKLIKNNENVLEKTDYNSICYVLDFLRDTLKVIPNNIEKCPSILYLKIEAIKENWKFLNEKKINTRDVETCLHILSTDPEQLKKTYEYVSDENRYGKKYIEQTTSILRVPVERIQEIEERCPELTKENILSAAISRKDVDEIKKIEQVCKDNEIEVTVRDCNQLQKKHPWLNYPIIRGVYSFVDSLVTGISTINYSASFYDDPAEQKSTKADEIGRAVFKDKLEAVLMAFTVILSVVFAVGLFMLIPYFVSRLLTPYVSSQFLLNFIEGLVRVVLFILYILAISQMKDIKRTFMYHGAEHKCINCIEHGARLTPENVKNSSRYHKRCGTSFLFLVMFVSVIFFIFIRIENTAVQLVLRILLIPVIAGVSYELIRWAGRSENVFITALSKPGLWLQKLTTKEPDMDMIEVAIKAVEEVFDWEAFLLDYYKDTEQPVAEMAANEASLAITSTIMTGADRNTRSLNPDEVVQENTQQTAQPEKEYIAPDDTDILEGGQITDAEGAKEQEKNPDSTENSEQQSETGSPAENKEKSEPESENADIKQQSESQESEAGEDDEDDDELPEGFEIIEDPQESVDTAAQQASESNLSVASDKGLEEGDGFEFIEDEEDEDYAEELPLFKERVDKK